MFQITEKFWISGSQLFDSEAKSSHQEIVRGWVDNLLVEGLNGCFKGRTGKWKLQYLFIKNPMHQKKTFDEFVKDIEKLEGVQSVLSKSESQYNLKKYKITEICAQNVLPIYQHIVEKFYKNHDIGDSATWVENQLRLFIWTVVCYLSLYKKSINEMRDRDWEFFAQVFYVKERNLFEYQARTLLDEEAKAARWSEEEDYMLYQLIMRDKNAKWNEIAKSLYINSGKRFLRPSKQCRERWLNHLDPNKSKLGWTIRELLTLFEHVEEKGKKWALLVKKLDEKRGQHTIKNKYNSIMKKQGKMSNSKNDQELRKQIICRLNKILQNQNLDSSDQFILGLNSKSKAMALFDHTPQYDNRYGPPINKNDALKKKFDDFRKKIEKFSSQSRQADNNKSLKTQDSYQMAPPMNKVTSLIQKLKSPHTFNFPAKKEQHQKKDDDSIFYQDSYDQIIPIALNNQEMLAEQINNFINESQIDF